MYGEQAKEALEKVSKYLRKTEWTESEKRKTIAAPKLKQGNYAEQW